MSVDEEMAVVPSAEGSRLVIKEMVLENFKSYAGEQRVGPFHKVHLLASHLGRRDGSVASEAPPPSLPRAPHHQSS